MEQINIDPYEDDPETDEAPFWLLATLCFIAIPVVAFLELVSGIFVRQQN